MKWLSGGLTFVNVSVVSAVLLGMAEGGLGRGIALVAVLLGAVLGSWAVLATEDPQVEEVRSSRAHRVWFWLLAACFAFFAFRVFCWLIFLDGNQLKVLSPNNLGDLSLHITYILNLASGVPLWPENPIYVFSHLRYPVGTDLFNSLLLLLGVDLIRGFVWAGLLGSLATFYALYRWGGNFGVAGFLFNGGLVGFQILHTWTFLDYQGDKTVAWKSLPLAMFVTQRGLLYALPVGLLLLYQWRARLQEKRGPLPLWVEISLYATLPFFHLHTFMALSIVAAFLFLIGHAALRKRLALVAGIAFLPATLLVWTITDHFKARSLMEWHPGWVQGVDDYPANFLRFWIENFGVLMPLVLFLVGYLLWRATRSGQRFRWREHPALAFLTPAALIFFFAVFVKTAPWGWDNIKLIIWAYLIMLPFLWSEVIARWEVPVRAGVCFALFASGFVTLFGGLLSNPNGHGFADRAEVDAVGAIVKKLPVEARFAGFPTYNHPLLLQGRKMVLGYPGHLWTQGFDYSAVEKQLNALMRGEPDWKEQAHALRVRYLFWGREEKQNYPASTRPWESETKLVASGEWGAIYDLDSALIKSEPRNFGNVPSAD
ncbi:MAG: hypothetical protein ABIR71_05515 [Chthoniobacterales bacterium]